MCYPNGCSNIDTRIFDRRYCIQCRASFEIRDIRFDENGEMIITSTCEYCIGSEVARITVPGFTVSPISVPPDERRRRRSLFVGAWSSDGGKAAEEDTTAERKCQDALRGNITCTVSKTNVTEAPVVPVVPAVMIDASTQTQAAPKALNKLAPKRRTRYKCGRCPSLILRPGQYHCYACHVTSTPATRGVTIKHCENAKCRGKSRRRVVLKPKANNVQ